MPDIFKKLLERTKMLQVGSRHKRGDAAVLGCSIQAAQADARLLSSVYSTALIKYELVCAAAITEADAVCASARQASTACIPG